MGLCLGGGLRGGIAHNSVHHGLDFDFEDCRALASSRGFLLLEYGLLGIAHRDWVGLPLDCNAVDCVYAWIGRGSCCHIIRMK